MEFSHLDTECFQVFLNQLSQYSPDYLNIIQLDNGKFHQSQKLNILSNIFLIFQPSYSPELNPIKARQYLKQRLTWNIYKNIEELKEEVRQILRQISPEIIISLTGWNYLLEALTVV